MPIKPPFPRYAKHPFEVSAMLGGIISSLSLFFVGPTASATADELGVPVLAWMAIAIALGSVAVIIAGYWKDVIVAAFIEMGGLFGVFGPILIFVFTASGIVENWTSSLATVALAAQAVAAIWRFVQIVQWVFWVYGEHPPEVWDRMLLREELDDRIDHPENYDDRGKPLDNPPDVAEGDVP